MAVESLTERPIFASEENAYLTPNRPPISRLAIGSFVLGILSSLVLINIDMIALPILAVALASGTYWQLTRSDALRGKTLTLLGLGMGVTFGLWSVTSTRLRDQYLYQVASRMAEHFAETLSQDRVLEAFELTLTETERQVAGTSLEEHYRLADEVTQERLKSFKDELAVKRIIKAGPEAKWQLKEGLQVIETHNQSVQIVVRLVDASQPKGEEVEVILDRQFYAGSAAWRVSTVR